jgi:hypothetical protein
MAIPFEDLANAEIEAGDEELPDADGDLDGIDREQWEADHTY